MNTTEFETAGNLTITAIELMMILGIVISFILFYFFIQLDRIKHGNRIHVYILLTVVIIGYFIDLFLTIESWDLALFFYPAYYPIAFCVYPLIYLYIKRLVFTKKELINERQIIYFILPFIAFLSTLIVYLPLSTNEKINFIKYEFTNFNNLNIEYQLYYIFLFLSYYSQFIVFLYMFFKLRRSARENMSDKIVVKNIVVQLIQIFIILITAYETILTILAISFTWEIYEIAMQITTLVLLLFLGILGINQSLIKIQTRLRKTKLRPEDINNEGPKYLIPENEKIEMIQLIGKVLSQKKLYLNPNLKLELFAKKLHVSPRKLSIVINDIAGDNFNNFLNKYRIEEAKKMLLNTENPASIENIYLRTGFNTRSTFNRAFKMFTGVTPKEFKSGSKN